MQTVGIDVDDQLKIATVSGKKGQYKIHCHSLPKGSDSAKNLNKKSTCTALSPSEFIIKELEMPALGNKALEKSLFFQMQTLTHLKEPIHFPLLRKKEKGKAFFSIYTTSKQTLLYHLNSLKKINIDPDYVSTTPTALLEYINSFSEEKTGIILDISLTKTTFVYFQEGEIKKSFLIPLGCKDLLPLKNTKTKVDLLTLKTETNRSLDSFIHKLKGSFFSIEKKPLVLFLTGEHGAFDFEPFLKHTFSSWFQKICKPENKEYAIAIGLAMQRARSTCVQFRQGELIPKKWTNNLLFSYSALFLFSLLGSIALYFYQSRALSQEEERIERQFTKYYQQNTGDKTPLSFTKRLSLWNKDLKKKPSPYLFYGPTVSECLAFLDSHPLISQIQIKHLDYRLVSYPKVGSANEPYKMEISLELKANKTVARKFYDDLCSNTTFLDPAHKCGWKNLENSFVITFYPKPSPPKAL